MTMPNEEKLTEALEQLAGRAVVPTDGLSRVKRRVRMRRNRRRTAMGALAVVAISGIALSANLVTDRERRVVSTANETQEQSQLAPVPRLTLNVADLALVDAQIGRTDFIAEQLTAPPSYQHYQSFRRAADDWRAPAVFIYTTSPEAPFEIGDGSRSGTTIVDINGSEGYLRSDEGLDPVLGWRLPDGTSAYVHAPGMDAKDLLALGRSMSLRADGQGWNVGGLPAELTPIIDERPTNPAGIINHSLTFAGAPGRVEMHSSTGTRLELETRVADLMAGATVESSTVRGYPAAVARTGQTTRVLWYDDTAKTVNYLIVEGDIEARLDDVVAGITELSEVEWNELLASTDTTYWTGDSSSPTSTSTP